MDENMAEGADTEVVPANMVGTESIVINGLKKSFTAINKKTVHAVQVIIGDMFS